MAHFSMPSHVLIGDKALEESMDILKSFGKKALIVTGPHVGKSFKIEELKAILDRAGIRYTVFDHINAEPTVDMIHDGAEVYKHSESDFVIGIGGGSPLDAAKAIVVAAKDSRPLSAHMGKEIAGDLPKIVAIPTTSGTGSEATKFTVITDTKTDIKMLLKGEALIPDLAIINPTFSAEMPQSVIASTGIDALTHAVEAYTSRRASALTDTFAVSAVKRIMKYLPESYMTDSKEAKEQMSLAAFEAGVCINNSSVTIVHGMSRPIGALFHVPHGISNAMLIVECLKFAADGAISKFANLARECGFASVDESDSMATTKFLDEIEKVCQVCEVPTLKKYGIDEKEFLNVVEKMASDAVASGSPGNTVKTVTEADCIDIYRKVISK